VTGMVQNNKLKAIKGYGIRKWGWEEKK